ncbi:MAG: polyketide synthase dehydratase domain-containing protein [Candidatus Riflebacteria bacterium]|nr:polyketide synthase dehydratase domain-containing protein [Candidatus Riflebacteria bacterium]
MSESCCFSITELPCLVDHQLEGTPFVPMAVLIDQLARTLNNTIERLTDIAVKMPVMLRKNRAKTLFCHREGNSTSLLDETGNLYASLASATTNHAKSAPPPVQSLRLPARTSSIGRSKLYPALMFHGPTFQADFKFYEFSAQTAVVELNGFDSDNESLGRYRSGQQIPIILADLAFQVIGLHLMAFKGIYALPATCEMMITHDPGPVKTALIRVFAQENGSYKLVATSVARAILLTCDGLRFQNTSRPVEPDKKNLLESIKT